MAVTVTSHLKLELAAAEREAARRGEDPTTGPAVTPGGGRAQGPGAAGATGAGAGRAGGAGAGPVRATDFMSGVSCSSLSPRHHVSSEQCVTSLTSTKYRPARLASDCVHVHNIWTFYSNINYHLAQNNFFPEIKFCNLMAL